MTDELDLERDREPLHQKFIVKQGHGYRIYAERDAKPFNKLPDEALLDSADLCELFGCSTRTLYRWVAERDLDAKYKVGREYLFEKGDVLAWWKKTRPQRGRPPY
jgi:excisionase family DNA binding protein